MVLEYRALEKSWLLCLLKWRGRGWGVSVTNVVLAWSEQPTDPFKGAMEPL